MSRITTPGFATFFIYVALSLLFGDSATASEDTVCSTALVGNAHATWRGLGTRADASQCFTAHLPAAGTWMLEVSARGEARGEPKIDFLGRRCDATFRGLERFHYRERYANRLWLEIHEAGQYLYCVTTQDPEEFVDDYKLTSHFIATSFEKEEDPDEHEPIPDPLTIGFLKDEDPDEHEPIPDPIVDPSEVSSIKDLCRRNRADDHSDTFLCATSINLGQDVMAQTHNPWGDDEDVFTFVIEELTTVRLSTTGNSNFFGSLHDHAGNRLKAAGGSASGANFRIVKTLSPGRYFVRVEGTDGTEGAYGLRVEELGIQD